MTALSSKLRGASKIVVVDKWRRSRKGIDAVGDQAQAGEGKDETPAVVLDPLVHAVRATGRLGVVGLYVPSDPGSPNEDAAEGKLLFEIGTFFEKGQAMGTGQADVKSYNRQLPT